MSNDHVLYSLIDYFSYNPEHKADSFVIPSWTIFQRVEFPGFLYKNDNSEAVRNPESIWATRLLDKRDTARGLKDYSFNQTFFERIFNEKYYYRKYLRQVILCQSYLENNSIPYLMFEGIWNSHEKFTNDSKSQTLISQIKKDKFLGFGKEWFITYVNNQILPCRHPTKEAHEQMAKILASEMKL